ncbi:alpha/beta hydrolase [Mycolicibacterium lutetiense]|uniref:Acetyl esterase/lipase n=1 Tax=Mycolicibacterium lutetiense TaxID=1641992 RepID=A0ABS5A1P5_9MYCO|nr:alpha/beta hydrolase [Mycolicibacterium lutetiense]MBP2454794.1 acetyl esterase/lipase [Mycolicibacterium lutetiense]
MRPVMTSGRLSLAGKRRIVEMIAGASKVPAGVVVESAAIAGVPVQRVTPPNARLDSTILLLHGGGYASGSAQGYRGLAGELATAANIQIIVADYRLAPEHPFPAALDDAFAVYRALSERVSTIAIAGDSAGGGLTLALAQRIRDASLPAPAALGLICPWLDLALDADALRPPRKDPLIVPELIAEWCTFYVGNRDAREPGISPIYGNVASLPPIVMHSAGDDPLALDADKLERELVAQSSGLLIHRRYNNLWHDFHLQVGFLAEADHAVALFGEQLAELVAAQHLPAERQPRQ